MVEPSTLPLEIFWCKEINLCRVARKKTREGNRSPEKGPFHSNKCLAIKSFYFSFDYLKYTWINRIIACRCIASLIIPFRCHTAININNMKKSKCSGQWIFLSKNCFETLVICEHITTSDMCQIVFDEYSWWVFLLIWKFNYVIVNH